MNNSAARAADMGSNSASEQHVDIVHTSTITNGTRTSHHHPVLGDVQVTGHPLSSGKPLRVDTIVSSAPTSATSSAYSNSSAGSVAAASALPPHLRDHVVSMSTTNSINMGAFEGELLPPIPAAPRRIPLLPENMKMEPTIGINQRRQTKRVIVCGAGIIGLTTCYYLAKQGHEVLCVEKERSVGTQVSLCNGAFLDPALYSSWSDIGLLRKGIPQSAGVDPKRVSSHKTTSSPVLSRDPVTASTTVASASEEFSSADNSPTIEVTDESVTPSVGESEVKPSSAAATVGVPIRRPVTRQPIKWPLRGKPMKIEMSAFRDTKFWKWGIQFFMNSKKKKSNEHGRTIRELGFYSMLKLRELQALTKKGELEMDQTAQGTIEVFRDAAEYEMTLESDRNKHLNELGMDLQPLSSTQAHNLEPALREEMYDAGAILSAFGTNGDVHKMCEALHKLCMRHGVMFRFNTEVQHILTDRTSVIALQTHRGQLIEGDEFVLALGNTTASLARQAGMKLSIYPVKGYVLSVPVHDHFKAPLHNIYAGGHALVSPLGRTLRISGGVDFSSPKKAKTNQKRFEWLLAQAKMLFPEGYLDVGKMTTHVCWRPVTPDDVPLIGRTSISNLFVNAGHGSKGWTLSFGAAALIADEISGLRPQLDMSKFDPHRFGFFG